MPGKNIRPLCGHPMIAWTLAAARATNLFDVIVVTTDSVEIASVVKRYDALTCRRPPDLASDTASVKDVVRHCLSSLESSVGLPDYTFLLQPTSPLREPADIVACLEALERSGADSAASFRLADEPIERAFRIESGVPKPIATPTALWLPRQAHQDCFYLNGAVYVATTLPFLADSSSSFLFGRTAASVMPPERSVDIDTEYEFRLAEMLLSDRRVLDPEQFLAACTDVVPFDFPGPDSPLRADG